MPVVVAPYETDRCDATLSRADFTLLLALIFHVVASVLASPQLIFFPFAAVQIVAGFLAWYIQIIAGFLAWYLALFTGRRR